jgi:hypothetical protein
VKAVDPPRSARLLDDETRLLQQPEMPRYRRAADRHRIRQLLDRSTLGAFGSQQLHDPASIRIAEGLEGIADAVDDLGSGAG